MLTILLRILFVMFGVVVFTFVGTFIGVGINRDRSDDSRSIYLAYLFNTVLLSVFFMLWLVSKGVI